MEEDKKYIRESKEHYLVFCPFCKEVHALKNKSYWNTGWSYDLETKTLHPSIRTAKCHWSAINNIAIDHTRRETNLPMIKF